ncbi:hypothetical protein HYALB_00000518 [Hymenoscyphus albidus]|uniref:Uncharacterized protein n=1 Tax=Hymenoscyphus albidus TaxID=595503 RepID=A0A9N9M354_9HELO|nr:hypothetical protein HYALB_00000518 [Hymenoscyphus albidus]
MTRFPLPLPVAASISHDHAYTKYPSDFVSSQIQPQVITAPTKNPIPEPFNQPASTAPITSHPEDQVGLSGVLREQMPSPAMAVRGPIRGQ